MLLLQRSPVVVPVGLLLLLLLRLLSLLIVNVAHEVPLNPADSSGMIMSIIGLWTIEAALIGEVTMPQQMMSGLRNTGSRPGKGFS
jgi:hypothetical protein